MSFNLEALTAEVTRAQTVQFSAVTLLKRLTTELQTIHSNLVTSEAEKAPLQELIDKLKQSTDGLAAAVADSLDKHPMHEVTLNADDPTKPTVQVVMPEVLPENVEVKAEVVVDTIDPASPEPQIVVTVTETPVAEVVAPEVAAADPAIATDTIETAPTQVDVNVTAEQAVVDEIKADAGIDVLEAVQEAVAEAEVQAVEAPVESVVLNADNPSVPTVQVVMPEVLPENVEVKAEVIVDKIDPVSPEPQILVTVEPTPAADVVAPEVAAADPAVATDTIETAPTQVDVNVTAEQAVVDAIKTETGVDVLEAVQEAVAEAEVPAEEAPVESVVLNADNPSVPTVQVVMPEVLPENVVVSTEQLVEKVDPASSEPQIAIYVEEAKPEEPAVPAAPAPADAPVEAVIETPADQTNVTVTVPAEVQNTVLAETGINVIEAVKEAVAEAEVPAAPAPADANVTP